MGLDYQRNLNRDIKTNDEIVPPQEADIVTINGQKSPETLFPNDSDGRRSVGRPKARWIDGVQSDLRASNVNGHWL